MWLIVSFTASAVIGGTSATLLGHLARRGRRARRAARPGSRARSARPRRRSSVSRAEAGTPWPCGARAPTARRAARRRRRVMRSTGLENCASSAATMRSHMHASISPAAAHAPCTAAIVSLGSRGSARSLSKYMTCSWSSLPSGVAAHRGPLARSPRRISLRSWPAEKCLPSPASTTTRTSSSASARSNAASSSSISCEFCAFAASGRFERDRRDRPVDLVADGLEAPSVEDGRARRSR